MVDKIDEMNNDTFKGKINDTEAAEKPVTGGKKIIGEVEIRKAGETLRKYKSQKTQLEQKIVDNEQFWKLRHWEQSASTPDVPATGWLWNVIVSKHADLEDGYPEPNILPREEGDKAEAKKLSSIIPVVMDQNSFKDTYSDCGWYKLKQGSAVYGVFWDGSKLNGLGDITINKIDILNLFWEPGISDIQKSKNVFHVELIDRDSVKARYPQLTDNCNEGFDITKYIYDDSIDTTDKVAVIDWYYKKVIDGRTTVQFVKFCGNELLYASENEDIGKDGWYAHGQYPFVFDTLFKIEGSPCGYGYTDICKDTQLNIDRLNYAIVDNAVKGSKRRYFVRQDGGINEEEYADWSNDFVHTSISLGEDSIREIQNIPLSELYVGILNNQIDSLKQTSGSTDASNGVAQSGVTAASAIAALQEASGKTSRDMLSTTYKAYKKIVLLVIELIRQFYTVEREFRITGKNGEEEFIRYSNENIMPGETVTEYGVEFGGRSPQFDIDVHVQKATTYTKMAQNEFALQLYNAGALAPQNADMALTLLDMMDFTGKDELISKISRNQQLMTMLQQTQQIAMSMAQRYGDMQAMQMLSVQMGMPMPQAVSGVSSDIKEYDERTGGDGNEHSVVEKARQQTQDSTQVRT